MLKSRDVYVAGLISFGVGFAIGIFLALVVGFRFIQAYSLIDLATLPMALKSIKVARKYCEEPCKMISVNILSILVHLITGLLLTTGCILDFLYLYEGCQFKGSISES